MPRGWVTTARGEALDLDALKNAANLPIAKAKQTKTEVPKRTYDRKPINVRGFQPGQGEHKPELEVVEAPKTKRIDPDEQPVVTSTTESGVAETLADVTGVKVKSTKAAVERAKARASDGSMPPPEDVAAEALGDILGELEKANPNAQAAADAEEEEKPARSRSRKTASE